MDHHLTVLNARDDLAECGVLAANAGGPGPPTEPVPIAPLLQDVADRYKATARGRPIRVQCADGLIAAVDARQLERAIANLIDNALRRGGGPIDIAATGHDDRLTVRVRDHGPGFPPDFLPKAFDRFTRPDTARTGPGTGLGLAIVAAGARRHAGTVRAANDSGGGAEVSLTMPGSSPAHPGPFRGPPRARGS